MERVTDKELKNYYSRVGNSIICDRRQKKEFLCQLKENVEEFISDMPEATMEDIVKVFGEPGTIAESFIANADRARIKKQVQLKKALIISVVIALIIYALFVVISLIDVHIEAHGYFEEGLLAISNIIKGGDTV